ncbi:MAG: biopolymer transporter ExbD [Bacteriovoracaceae bacterium]|nr:biopolymer transporter ExbD [Bacteriovoracaceae bacterium]
MARKKRREGITSLDLTALIDIVFQLLVFFMISTVFKQDRFALKLSLPSAFSSEATKAEEKKYKTIELKENVIAIDGEEVTMAELGPRLSSFNKDGSIFVRADEGIAYKKVVEVLDILQKLELRKISLITNKK